MTWDGLHHALAPMSWPVLIVFSLVSAGFGVLVTNFRHYRGKGMPPLTEPYLIVLCLLAFVVFLLRVMQLAYFYVYPIDKPDAGLFFGGIITTLVAAVFWIALGSFPMTMIALLDFTLREWWSKSSADELREKVAKLEAIANGNRQQIENLERDRNFWRERAESALRDYDQRHEELQVYTPMHAELRNKLSALYASVKEHIKSDLSENAFKQFLSSKVSDAVRLPLAQEFATQLEKTIGRLYLEATAGKARGVSGFKGLAEEYKNKQEVIASLVIPEDVRSVLIAELEEWFANESSKFVRGKG